MDAMFNLQDLSDRGLGFLAYVGRGEVVASAFWNPLRAACEAELARRAAGNTETGPGFEFPDLSAGDAKVVANEMVYLAHRMHESWDDDLVMLIASLGLAANPRTRELCRLN